MFEKLKDLQDILVNKYELEAKIEDAPKHLGIQEDLLSKLKKEYIVKNTEYEALKEKINGIKVELDAAIKLREDGEKGMDNISTHREYEALEKQINEAKLKEEDLRKDLSQQEKSLQALDETLKTDEFIISSQETEIKTAKDSIDKEIAKYNSELTKLQEKESNITPSLDQEILFKFERIIQRNSEGIVAVKNGVCTGCHMILPAQFANTVREGENILFCPYCSRILFYEESEEGDNESYYSMEEAGSLADLDYELEEDEDFDDDDRAEALYEKDSDASDESDESEDSDWDEDEDSDDEENQD
ncbi:MAG: C4-type zinc ribbon domain-containing protein [Treponema sp.]|nr:C4-type zinc ribbon domain-containing protein [Treponema sp.]